MTKKNYHKPPEGPRTIGGGLKAQGRARREKLMTMINSKPRTLRNDLLPTMELQTLAIADLEMLKHMVRKLHPGHFEEVANGIQPMGFSGDRGRPRRRSAECSLRKRLNAKQRRESTYCGRSRPRPWTPQLGGKRAYEDRLGKDRSAPQSRHYIAGAKYASPPEAALRHTLHQRLPLGDLGHLWGRRKAFEGGGENSVGVGRAAGRLVELGEGKRRQQFIAPRALFPRDGDGGAISFLSRGGIGGVPPQQHFAANPVKLRFECAIARPLARLNCLAEDCDGPQEATRLPPWPARSSRARRIETNTLDIHVP
jgi:hypothetical protein